MAQAITPQKRFSYTHYGLHTPGCPHGLPSLNLVSMMEEPDLMDLPDPVEYHDHGGEEVPVYRVYSPIQEPGKEPEDIAFGLLCVVCGFTPTPRVPLKRRN